MKKKIIFFLLITTNLCVAQVNLNNGLKAYYPFNDNVPHGKVNDESGNKNHVAFNNALFTYDLKSKNSYYYFNGVDQYMRIPNSPSLNFNNQISISVWVEPTGFNYGICHASQILSKGGGDYNPGNYALRFDDALFSEGTGCNGTIVDSLHQNFRGTGTILKPYKDYIKKNQLYNIVYTNDGDTAKLYVDCQLKYAVYFPETFTNKEDLFIGKSDDTQFPFWFKGYLDNIRIYNRSLTLEEILALCNKETEEEEKKEDIKKIEPVVLYKEPELEKRNNDLIQTITVDSDSISVTLYDNGEIDGDSITLIYNDKILTKHQRLTDKPLTFFIKIKPGNSRNELLMYAENLGSIPPNTALIIIKDGDKRYELNVNSTKNSNGAVSFKLRE